MFTKTARALFAAILGLTLILAGVGAATASTTAYDTQTTVTTVTTVALGTSGGGTTCTSAGSYGRVCAVLYRGTSGYHRPYMRIDQSSTSPSVSSATATVQLCTLDTFNRCARLQSQNFSVTQGLNKRSRCGVIIRGEVGDNLPCEVGGNGYTPGKSRTKTIVTFSATASGVTRKYVVSSPVLTVS